MKKMEFLEKQLKLPFYDNIMKEFKSETPFVFANKKQINPLDCIGKVIRYIPSDKYGKIKITPDGYVIDWYDRKFNTMLDNEYGKETLKKCEIVENISCQEMKNSVKYTRESLKIQELTNELYKFGKLIEENNLDEVAKTWYNYTKPMLTRLIGAE